MRELFISILLIITAAGHAQLPVTWTFSTKKIGPRLYEMHALVTLDEGWHIYAQVQPAKAIASPTTFDFNKNPLTSLNGKVEEIGEIKRHRYESLGVIQNEYDGKVEFVQAVSKKAEVKTTVGGTVKYQVCTDDRCLPPTTVTFSIALD